MNNESGSTLQKANFALLVLIACALAYLIERERIQSRHAEPAPQLVDHSAPGNSAATASWNPAEMKRTFSPLRPRPQTNSEYTLPAKRSSASSVSTIQHDPAQYERPAVADGLLALPAAPAPAARVVEGVGAARGVDASIVGRVFLKGQPPPEKQVALDAACARLRHDPLFTRHFVVGREAGLANVFVYIKEGAPKDSSKQPSQSLDVDECEFSPYVLGVRAGQGLMVHNWSPLLENLHFIPKAGSRNRERNISLPTKGASVRVGLDFPEMFIKVKCDVHPWMFAYISVVEHRWFTVTEANGNFSLPPGLPPGRYTLAAAHLKAGEVAQEITISDGAPPSISLTLSVPQPLAQNR